MAEIDLIKELQEKNKDIPPKYIKKIFSDVHEMLEEKLAKEKSIKFFNFGKIKLLERKERNSRNPKTGEKIIVPKKLVLKFIPGKKWKNFIHGEKADNWSEMLKVIDKNGEWHGKYKNRKIVSNTPGMYFNSVMCWFYNKKDDTLMLQKRSKYKKFGPNQLGLTGGHVMGDDSLEKTLFKEVEEEIGVDLRMLKKPVYINCVRPWEKYKSFSYQYLVIIDDKIKNISFNANEVSEIVYLPFSKVYNDIKNNSEEYYIKWERCGETMDEIKKYIELKNEK